MNSNVHLILTLTYSCPIYIYISLNTATRRPCDLRLLSVDLPFRWRDTTDLSCGLKSPKPESVKQQQ